RAVPMFHGLGMTKQPLSCSLWKVARLSEVDGRELAMENSLFGEIRRSLLRLRAQAQRISVIGPNNVFDSHPTFWSYPVDCVEFDALEERARAKLPAPA